MNLSVLTLSCPSIEQGQTTVHEWLLSMTFKDAYVV